MIEDKKDNSDSAATILVSDKDKNLRSALSDILIMEGYNVIQADEKKDVLTIIENNSIDLILLEVYMPEGIGFQITEKIKNDEKHRHIPIIIITANEDYIIRIKALKLGADDFLVKPPHLPELLARVRSLLKVKIYNEHMLNYQVVLERQVMDRTRQFQEAMDELTKASIETVFRLSRAAEYKDDDSASHIKRTSKYAEALAEKAGLPEDFVALMNYSTPMHDIGKIGIPDSILMKPGKLDEDESKIMKEHPQIGADILEGSSSRYLQCGRTIALSHHEKWDGTGYPAGIAGEDIPLEGRIVAVVDVFDALTSKRPYKKPFSPKKAFGIIKKERGKHFDPELADCFLDIDDRIMNLMNEYGDEG